MAASSVGDVSTLNVLLRGKTHAVPLADNVGALRVAIEHATSVPAQSQVLLCRGKKLDAKVPDDAAVADFKLLPGGKVMLQVVPPTKAAARGGVSVPDSVAGVRAIDIKVAAFEKDLARVIERVAKLRLGFLDKEKTSAAAERIRLDCTRLEETLMQQLLAADRLDVPAESEHVQAQFRAERKALVDRINTALKRCDVDARAILDATEEDVYDEMKHRRGKPP